MKKKLLLFIFTAIVISCTNDKKMLIQREDIIGQWKEIQRKPSGKTPVYNIPKCGDKKANGQLYIFNADSTYTVKDFCPGGEIEQEGTWIYRDHVLSLTSDSINIKYSLVDEGDSKIKFAVISLENNGRNNMDWFKVGTYSIFEKN